MKHLKNWFFVLGALLAVYACDRKTNEQAETSPDSVATSPEAAPADLNSDQSDLLDKILGDSEEGVLRGISFGDPIAKVKATETFDMFEEKPDYLGYTYETAQLENIDIQYFLSPDKKVNKITIDVYLNSSAATKQLWNAGKNHFTQAYDAPKEDNQKKVVWNSKNVKLDMEDVSEGKDYGLKFQFFPANKNVLASTTKTHEN